MTAAFTCDAPAFTTVNGNIISAPNAEITDWTPKNILSRTVARILAKGLHVDGVYGDADAWFYGDICSEKIIQIDVSANQDSEVIGTLIVRVRRYHNTGATTYHVELGKGADKLADRIDWKGYPGQIGSKDYTARFGA